jgi:hypothetical protein
MEAYSSLPALPDSLSRPQLEEVHTPSVASRPHGDFAAGLRSDSGREAATRGCFATGVHRPDTVLSTGDFAAGLRSGAQDALPLGDFATGQRADHGTRPDGQRPRPLK